MAYTFKHISNCIIAIKTKARLFYGDYNKYEQFKKEIYSIIYNDYNKIIEDINACKKKIQMIFKIHGNSITNLRLL